MSADNGIYILKTKDQYRVAHLCAIDNVTWSVIDGDWCTDMNKKGKLVPTRVVEMWGNCKYTRNKNKAFEIAHKWDSSLPICEYGVNVIIQCLHMRKIFIQLIQRMRLGTLWMKLSEILIMNMTMPMY